MRRLISIVVPPQASRCLSPTPVFLFLSTPIFLEHLDDPFETKRLRLDRRVPQVVIRGFRVRAERHHGLSQEIVLVDVVIDIVVYGVDIVNSWAGVPDFLRRTAEKKGKGHDRYDKGKRRPLIALIDC